MTSERYRWLLVDGFVDRFNTHRARYFIPSELICVDESISRWYGQGGDWINHGLPMYVAIDRKPENGCEIQNAACAESGVMIRLRLVKTKTEEESGDKEDVHGILHGTKILKYLVSPWRYSDRMVCADSYFASVPAAEELKKMRLRFIGVVKTAVKRFPMAYLANEEMEMRGERRALISKTTEDGPTLMAFSFLDRDRRYFIASGSSMQEGTPFIRRRWRQVEDVETQLDPIKLS